MFALWSSPNCIPIKYRGPIKKTSHLRPIYLEPVGLGNTRILTDYA